MGVLQTEDWNSHVSTNTRGSRTVAWEAWHHFEIVPFVVAGDTVYKAGRTTGVTGGWVSKTCENYYDGDTVSTANTMEAFLCFDEVRDASAGTGDSGSPVFYPADVYGNPPYAIGILSAAVHAGSQTWTTDSEDNSQYCTANCRWIFTEWPSIEVFLSRYLSPRPATIQSTGISVTIDGSSTAWQGAELTWAAVPNGGTGPYWYEWAGFEGAMTGSDSTITYTPNQGGLVEVLVWDAFGNWGLGNLTVTWCGEYAC